MGTLDPDPDRLMRRLTDDTGPAARRDPQNAYPPAELVEDVTVILATIGIRVDPPDQVTLMRAAAQFIAALGVDPDDTAPGIRAKRPTPQDES